MESISIQIQPAFKTKDSLREIQQHHSSAGETSSIESCGSFSSGIRFNSVYDPESSQVFGAVTVCDNAPAQDPEDLQWEGFSLQLTQNRKRLAISEAQIEIANAIRLKFKTQIHRSGLACALQPQASPYDGILQLSWDSPNHHIDFEIRPGRDVSWFYMNLETDQSQAGRWSWSGSHKKIPKCVWPYLQRLLSDKPTSEAGSLAR
jgi:hypothetical protein